VFDYDWGVQDDFLGAATFDLNQLELNKWVIFKMDLIQ
jgi:hypothetical protein